MELERYRIGHWGKVANCTALDVPFAIMDLDETGPESPSPQVPLLAVGSTDHPLAHLADIVAADEDALMTVARNILACPQASAVTVQLLRLVQHLPVAEAQIAESLAYATLQGGAEHARWLTTRKPSARPPEGKVRLDRDDRKLTITLDRAEAHNAIDRPMRDALREAFELAVLDDSIEQVVLQGVGKAFSIGAELGEFGTTRDPAAAHGIRMATLPAHMIARCTDKLAVHIQGACVGAGLEMAAYAARITATRSAWFQLPELAMGLLPGAGGSVSVMRRIGRHRAGWMMLSGKRVSAATALEWGLVDALVDD